MIPLAAALLAAAGAPVQGSSFDCRRAISPGERIVCADAALAASDRRLAARYAAALATSDDPPALRQAQRGALAVRDACRTRSCVAAWYGDRAKALAPAPAARAAPALAVGGCTVTRVARVGSRLEGAPDSGAFIAYADGLAQVSYDAASPMRRSRAGDPVRLCVVSRPLGCPVGDTRGSVYAARNGRTGERWTAGDSSHRCGGA